MVSTVTAFQDMAPSPRVIIDIDDAELDSATDTITVLQLSKWGSVDVRGGIRRPVAGGFVVTDYELPPGIPVTYRVMQYDAAGVEIGYALSLHAQVNIPRGWVLVQDPLVPARAVLLRAQISFASVLSRSRATSVYQVDGHAFAMSGPLSAFKSVSLSCFTESEADRESLAEILTESLILVRSGPEMRLPGAFFATVTDVPMIPVDAQDAGIYDDDEWDRWDITGQQVSRPALEVVAAVYSYDVFKAYLDMLHPPTPGTYDDAAATWATYIDAMRNPPPDA